MELVVFLLRMTFGDVLLFYYDPTLIARKVAGRLKLERKIPQFPLARRDTEPTLE